jgi:hypothetical protein
MIENELDGQGVEKVGNSLAYDREKPDSQEFPMRLQEVSDLE